MKKIIFYLICCFAVAGCGKKNNCYECHVFNTYTEKSKQISDYCGGDVKEYMNKNSRTFAGFGGYVYKEVCTCSVK